MALPETERMPHEANAQRSRVVMLAATALIGLGLLAAAIGLWARHGAAVFFDMVAAGIAYCF